MDTFSDLNHYRDVLEPALEYCGGTHTWDDIALGVLNGRYQLWFNENSAIISEIITYPRKSELNFFLAGGTLEGLAELYPAVEGWGKEQGCTGACCVGRKGWGKSFLADEGYEEHLVVLSKEFSHG
jgi:hypothetical protein